MPILGSFIHEIFVSIGKLKIVFLQRKRTEEKGQFADFFRTYFAILIRFFFSITNGLNALLFCLWFHLKCSSVLAEHSGE